MGVALQWFLRLLMRPAPRSTLFPYTTLFRSISRSSVPCNSSMRSRSSLVDILGENRAFLVECQGEDTVYTRSEEHTSELQSLTNLVCRLLLEKKKSTTRTQSLRLITSLDS